MNNGNAFSTALWYSIVSIFMTGVFAQWCLTAEYKILCGACAFICFLASCLFVYLTIKLLKE